MTLLVQCGGCWSGGLGAEVQGIVSKAVRVLYVPMADSLLPEVQKQYEPAERAQEAAFERTPFVRLPSIQQLCRGYDAVHWSRYGDPSPQLYKAGSRLHLRPKAGKYMLDELLRLVQPGDLVLVLGWNANNYEVEFSQQAAFGLLALGAVSPMTR